jgi:glutamate N-acetyltransferase/amino-acid N-acetyltransferase
MTRSPLALPFPDMPPIAGVTLRTARALYKDWDRCDLTFAELAPGTAVAGVLTQSRCPSPEWNGAAKRWCWGKRARWW